MAKKQRLRREDPERTAPIRRFSTMFRKDEQDNDKTRDGPSTKMQDDISDAVRMGYSVIEEQIRQGQRAAQQLGGMPSGVGSATFGVNDIANRLLQYSTDLAALHFDLMATLLHPAAMSGAMPGAAPSQDSGARVMIEIESKRKNQVTLDLWPHSQTANLTVPALHAAESDKSPLTDVSFVPGTDDVPARLHIVVSDSQPPGLYSGLILDADSGQANGTLSLRLDEL